MNKDQKLVFDFLKEMRKEHPFWFVGEFRFLDDTDNPPTISETQRGHILDNDVWVPFDGVTDELYKYIKVKENFIPEKQPCCEDIDTSDDIYALEEHCRYSDEHMENLVKSLTPEQLEREVKYILSRTFEALETWGDD